MKLILTAFLMSLYFFGTGAVSHAQGIAWETLNSEALSLGQQGNYDRAVVVAKKALKVAEQEAGTNHSKEATSLNNLALLYCNQEKYAQAEPLYKRALATIEKALGPDHPDIATILNNQAVMYDDQKKFTQAEPLYKRALEIMEKALGPDHPDIATILDNLAALYRAQEFYAQAEPLFKRALAVREKVLGPDHPDVAESLENLAALYRKTGQDKAAEELENRAASILNSSININKVKYIAKDPIPGEEAMPASSDPITPAASRVQAPSSDSVKKDTVGAPKITVGDSYTFEVENTSDSKLSYVMTRQITAVNGNRMTVETTNIKSNTKHTYYYDLNWGYLGSLSADKTGVSFSPALKYFDFPLRVGKKWTAKSTETDKKTGHQRHHTISGSVTEWEKVQVPAGEFEALKIVLKTEVKENGKSSSGTDTSWYVPALHRSVKTELTGPDASNGSMEKKIIRLVSYHVQ